MEDIELESIAMLISFVILLDINITVYRNMIKKKYKRKSDKFKEKARAKGNCVVGKEIKSKYYDSWRDADGHYHGNYYKVTYEYVVNGKKYKKKLQYGSDRYPRQLDIYYSELNPRYSIAEDETKNGLFYNLASLCALISFFVAFPLLSYGISILINMFKF